MSSESGSGSEQEQDEDIGDDPVNSSSEDNLDESIML